MSVIIIQTPHTDVLITHAPYLFHHPLGKEGDGNGREDEDGRFYMLTYGVIIVGEKMRMGSSIADILGSVTVREYEVEAMWHYLAQQL